MRRVRDTADRRRVIVEATPKAHRRAWTLYGKVAEKLSEQLERYPDQELELLARLPPPTHRDRRRDRGRVREAPTSRYQQLKTRIGTQRGAKVAQIDLARRLTGAIWHMLTRDQPFAPKGATDPLAA